LRESLYLENFSENRSVLFPSALDTSSSAVLCQQQVHQASARRLLCLRQTRPRVIGSLGSNADESVSPLSTSRRVPSCILDSRVDHDLLIAYSSFEEESSPRNIIEETLLATGIVRAPLKDCFDISDPDPDRPLGLHHVLHWQRNKYRQKNRGEYFEKRCEAFCFYDAL
jgi:hypothetical protein